MSGELDTRMYGYRARIGYTSPPPQSDERPASEAMQI